MLKAKGGRGGISLAAACPPHPRAVRWALPGGPIDPTEGLEHAGGRHLLDTTALSPTYLEQLHVFDHNAIVEYALRRLGTKVEYSRIAHAFLGETFTLAELRHVHEAVLRRALDPANFRRQMESSPAVIAAGEHLAKAAGTVCSPDLAEGPWVFDRQTEPSYRPGSSMGDIIPAGSPRQGQLPEEYRTAAIQQLADRIHAVKQTLSECVVVLCGVCCMVETANILAGPPQWVILPNLAESSPSPPMPRRYSRGPSSAASGCSSSPTSSWGATPRRRWAFRSNTCRYRTRASRWAATATSRWRMPASSSATARLVAREPGVFSGGRSSPLP